MNAVVLIDGGYLSHFTRERIGKSGTKYEALRLDFGLLGRWAAHKAGATSTAEVHYFNALPAAPHKGQTKEEADHAKELIVSTKAFYSRIAKRQEIITHTQGNAQNRYCKAEYDFPNPDRDEQQPWVCNHVAPQQKMVDTEMVLLIAECAYAKPDIDLIVLLTGDQDITPACDLAMSKGKKMFFLHGSAEHTHKYYFRKPTEHRYQFNRRDLEAFRDLRAEK